MILFISEYKKVTSEKITSWEIDTSADCGVVLTGGGGRVKEGFSLLSRKQIRRLIISGVNPQADLREIFPQWALYGDINERDVVLDKRSGTTYGNAQHTQALAEALKCKDLAIITSQIHMYRAWRTFNASFRDSLPLYKHTLVSSPLELRWWETSNEVIKSIFYSIWAY